MRSYKYFIFYKWVFLMLSVCCIVSCKKSWLDEKQNRSDVVPTTLKDLQAVLDGHNTMNDVYPALALVGADNFYLTDAKISSATVAERNAYLWAPDIFAGSSSTDWNFGYKVVEYSNIVLDGLSSINVDVSNQADYNNVKGSALFFRSFAFYTLSQSFCKPYRAATAGTDLGIPIRLSSNVNEVSVRATVQQTYQQMIADLKASIDLLPVNPLYVYRPSRPAANALLAKIYLSMEDYSNALSFANAALADNASLLDYNNTAIVPQGTFRFPTAVGGKTFSEILFFAQSVNYATIRASTATGIVDSILYRSYNNNDLRKTIFYKDNGGGNIQYFGSYTGGSQCFAGIANNEVYLIQAECNARLNSVAAALTSLNALLIKRWKAGTFTAVTAVDADDALTKILTERRKELPFTGQLRWEDLRRLNNDSRFSQTLKHFYNGNAYSLAPNDNKYVLPIPDNEIQLSGMPQNPR
jgi:starch-binding outer membrane protein, SusD/RagB family